MNTAEIHMMKDMTAYFGGEKQKSVLFILAALIAIGLAVWLWSKGHRLRFMALPLVLVAVMQLVVGVTIFARTDGQLASLSTPWVSTPTQLKQAETERVQILFAEARGDAYLKVLAGIAT